MKIIIVGVGKLGEYLAKSLVKENHEVTLVDCNFKRAQYIINNEDLNYITGNGLDVNTLISAGVSDADILISVVDKDEENLMCCLLGKKLGAKHTIARVREQQLRDSVELIKDDIGLSMIINPENLTAGQISQIISIPSALETSTFFKGKIQMLSIKVSKDSKLSKSTVNEISKKTDGRVIVCAIKRKNSTIIPKGNTIILPDDKLHVIGSHKSLISFLKYADLLKHPTKNVIISGGSDTAIYLAKILDSMDINTKIIEIDEDRCKKLAELLPKTLVINGDVSDQNLLLEEGIEKCDCFVSLNSIDEENVVYSMFAREVGVPKVITKVNHINLSYVIEKTELDTIITPHIIATNQIVKYVRAMSYSGSSSCESIYKFNNFEMLEFKVNDSFKYTDIKLRNINMRDGIIVSAILRGRTIIFPGGSDVIKNDDTLIIVSNSNINITKIEDIME